MKKMRQLIKKTFCGLLAAAMVLTSTDFTVLAIETVKENYASVAEDSPMTEDDLQMEEPGENQEAGSEESGIEESGEYQEASGEESDTETSDDDSDMKTPEEGQQTPGDEMDEEPDAEKLGEDQEEPGKEPGIEIPEENVQVISDEADVTALGQCGDNLTWKLTTDGTLTISGTGDMWDYEEKSIAPWVNFDISKLVINRGVTSIGDYAFDGCSDFAGELEIPESVDKIGVCAFRGCTGFTGDLIIPEGVTSVEDRAFGGCSGFTGNLMISTTVIYIGEYAFCDCDGFKGSLEISEGVAKIGRGAFYRSGFTGDLVIPESVTEIGMEAFWACGFTGDLVIPGSLTRIANSTFAKCGGFKGKLVISEGVESIGKGAFEECSGFTGNLVIPEGVTEIGSYAFYHCTHFTGNLVIPEGVKTIGGEAFSSCICLNGNAVIPASVTSIGNNRATDIALSTITTIYGDSGSYAQTYAELTNKTFISLDSLQTSCSPIEDGSSKNQIHVFVIGGDKVWLPVGGAMVNGVIVDRSQGYTALPITKEGKMSFTITAEGYETLETQRNVEAGGTYYFSLIPESGGLKILSVSAQISDQTTNLLTDKLYLQTTDENIEDSSNKSYMTIRAKAPDTVMNYALFQDDKLIAQNVEGIFSIPVIEKRDGKISTNLEASQQFYLEVTDKKGRKNKRAIGLCVDEVQVDTEEFPKGISIMPEVSSGDMAENIPYFGGMDASFGFLDLLNIKMEVQEDGLIRIAIGMEDDQDFRSFKEEYNHLKSKSLNMMSSAGSKKSFSAAKISGDVSFCGYGEGYIGKNNSDRLEVNVGIILSGKISGTYTQYFFAGVIPFHVSMEAGFEISVGADNATIIWEDRNLQLGGNLILGGKIYLKPKIAVGIEDLAALGVSGTGEANLQWKPRLNEEDYWKIWLSGYLSVYGQVLGFESTLFQSPTASWTIYETGQSAALQSVSKELDSKMLNSANYTLIDRSYMTTKKDLSEDVSVENAVYSAAVYPGASPQLVYAGEMFYLFWLQDIESRNLENRAAIVYATSIDGENWDEPVQLVPESENRTLDGVFDLYVDNDRIYICWQDAAEEFASGIDLNNAIQKLYISYAVVDGASGKVLETKTVTDTEGCYLQPRIVVKDGNVYLTFVSNHMTTGNDIWSTDNTEELMRYDSVRDELITLTIGNGREKITGMDMAVVADGAGAYYIIDTDGDLQTIDDRALVYDTRNGSNGTQTIMTNEGQVFSPSVVGEACYWYADGNLYSTYAGNMATSLYEMAPENLPASFQAVSDGTNTLLLWSAIDSETEQVSLYGIERQTDGSWTLPFVIEQTDSDMTGESTGVYRNGNLFISYPHIHNEEDGSRTWSLCVTKETKRCDISLDYAYYDEQDFHLGEVLPITVELSNKGNTAVESVELYWDGASLGSQSVDIGVGETGIFVLEKYTVPTQTIAYEKHTLTVRTPGETITGDNSQTIGIGYTNIALLVSQRLQNGSTWLDISVLNESDIATDCTLNIHAKSENGKVLYSEELGEIVGKAGIALSISLQEYEDSNIVYYVEVVPDVEDVIEENNIALVYTGYGAPIRESDGGSEKNPETYTVSFNSNGGSAVKSQQVEAGMTIAEPQVPTRDGYYFVGWFLSGALYDFSTPVTGNITLEAVWEVESVLAAPSANIPSGSQVEAGTKLVLTCAAPGAQIYYTTDGSKPTMVSTLYQESIELWQDTIIKAVAVKEGYANSQIVTFSYTVRKTDYREYTLTFDSQGGTAVEAIVGIPKGSTVILPQPTREGYLFLGWYTEPSGAGRLFDEKSIVTEDLILYAFWRAEEETNGLWFSAIADQTYTGSAIQPVIRVYYENTLLKEKTDYTLTYKNNKNANDAVVEANAPTITVKGKGSYGGKETVTFRILPKDLKDEDIDYNFTDAYEYKAGTQPKLSLSVKYGKQTLKKDRDYTLSYKNSAGVAVTDISAEGIYTLVVAGQANYVGSKEMIFTVSKTTPVSKLKLSKIASITYDGTEKTPGIILKNGKTTLAEGTDYKLTYSNNVDAGKATVVITGIGSYSGSRSATFTIKGTALNKVAVKGMNTSVEYTGKPIYQTVQLTTKVKEGGVTTEKILKEGEDYQVNFSNNTAVGQATMTLTGKGGYTGTVKKTFTIKAYDIKADSSSKISISTTPITALYAKGGAKPDVEIRFGGRKLVLGTDYTLTYSNNKAVTTSATSKKPAVTIKGKGSFKGMLTAAKNFTIEKQNLSAVKSSSDDVVYKNKAGNYKSVPILYDLNDKKLLVGKDYSKDYQYTYVRQTILTDGTVRKAGEYADENDIVPAGTEMMVTISASETSGNANYKGETQANYHVTQNSLKKAKVKILTNFEYTGKEIRLTKDDLQITPKGVSQPTDSYEILEDTYTNNVKKGTASVQIRGIGDYGGVLTVKYKIKSRGFSWWFRGLLSH